MGSEPATEEERRGGVAARPAGTDSIFRTAEVVGDAWSWLVLREAILHGVTRFSEFQERLGVPRSTLSARLAQLTAGALLERQSSGPQYQLTASGADFLMCLMVAMRWGDHWFFTPDTRPQPVTHRGCGHKLGAVLRCSGCSEILAAAGVIAARGGSPRRPGGDNTQRRRNASRDLLERKRTCSIARTLAITGDWWSGLIIRECFFGTRRFDEFQRRLDIAPNVLSGRLRRLVELGILAKVQYETWPIRHEYHLTEQGLDLYPMPLAMLTWGQRWLAPSQSEPHLVHRPCGHPVRAVLACGSCADAIDRDDIILS